VTAAVEVTEKIQIALVLLLSARAMDVGGWRAWAACSRKGKGLGCSLHASTPLETAEKVAVYGTWV
jgi:hypothetical protein